MSENQLATTLKFVLPFQDEVTKEYNEIKSSKE